MGRVRLASFWKRAEVSSWRQLECELNHTHAYLRSAARACYSVFGDWQIVDEYTEVESGKRSDRPELDKALAASRLHRASLVVSKVDRLTRSVAFLSRLLEAGVNLRIVQILLGHASIGTTAVYTHLTEPTRAGLKTLLDKLMAGL